MYNIYNIQSTTILSLFLLLMCSGIAHYEMRVKEYEDANCVDFREITIDKKIRFIKDKLVKFFNSKKYG